MDLEDALMHLNRRIVSDLSPIWCRLRPAEVPKIQSMHLCAPRKYLVPGTWGPPLEDLALSRTLRAHRIKDY